MIATTTPGAATDPAPAPTPPTEISGMAIAADAHARELRAASDAQPRAKGDPPTWASTIAKAELVGLVVSGPIAPSAGGTMSVSLLRAATQQRVYSAQAQRYDGEDDNRDRLLRAGLNAALWALGAR